MFYKNGQRGAAALEYILVSLFATGISLAAFGIVSKIFQSRVSSFSEKFGIDVDTSDFDFDSESSDP